MLISSAQICKVHPCIPRYLVTKSHLGQKDALSKEQQACVSKAIPAISTFIVWNEVWQESEGQFLWGGEGIFSTAEQLRVKADALSGASTEHKNILCSHEYTDYD